MKSSIRSASSGDIDMSSNLVSDSNSSSNIFFVIDSHGEIGACLIAQHHSSLVPLCLSVSDVVHN